MERKDRRETTEVLRKAPVYHAATPWNGARVYTVQRKGDPICVRANLFYCAGAAILAVTGYLATQVNAQQSAPVKVGADEIGGVVSSAKGPEAGVWVIAETTDLPTRYIKEVVTDDRGRYLIPDLPKAKYTVWARGYGLVDSPKVQTETGKQVDLKPTVAPDAKTAAKYYPANYWYSMMKIPDKKEFPGTGPSGNGISPDIKTQGQWIHLVKTDSCESCHQLGNAIHAHDPADVREPRFAGAGVDAPHPIRTGRQRDDGRADATRAAARLGRIRRIGPRGSRKGELPAEAPPRPQGVERNVVITQWDWADPKAYLHDEISTDKRNPTVNANGLIYGSPEESRDYLPVLDPVHNTIAR